MCLTLPFFAADSSDGAGLREVRGADWPGDPAHQDGHPRG